MFGHGKIGCMKRVRNDCILILIIILLAGGFWLIQYMNAGQKEAVLQIYQNGELIGEYELSQPQTIPVTGIDDNYNPIKRDKFLVVKRDYKYTRIPIDEILFVDCEKDYLRFHLEGKKNVMTLGNLKHLEEKLPKDKFKRVHRSYLANMAKFDTIDQTHITYGSEIIPISETYLEVIKTFLDDHSL